MALLMCSVTNKNMLVMLEVLLRQKMAKMCSFSPIMPKKCASTIDKSLPGNHNQNDDLCKKKVFIPNPQKPHLSWQTGIFRIILLQQNIPLAWCPFGLSFVRSPINAIADLPLVSFFPTFFSTFFTRPFPLLFSRLFSRLFPRLFPPHFLGSFFRPFS